MLARWAWLLVGLSAWVHPVVHPVIGEAGDWVVVGRGWEWGCGGAALSRLPRRAQRQSRRAVGTALLPDGTPPRRPTPGSSASQPRCSNSWVTWGKRLRSTSGQGCLPSWLEALAGLRVGCAAAWVLLPGALLGPGWRLSSGGASHLPLCWGWPEALCHCCWRLQPGVPAGWAWRLCTPAGRGSQLALMPSRVVGCASALWASVATPPGGTGHRWEAGRLGSLPGHCCGQEITPRGLSAAYFEPCPHWSISSDPQCPSPKDSAINVLKVIEFCHVQLYIYLHIIWM